MAFSQKSDVKKHLVHPLKKTSYLTPENQNSLAERVDQESAAGAGGTATLLDDLERILAQNMR
jgi:hypothetical protein